ncbi:FUSC family protein [Roseococcus sp.]|uniref:FUSC family protein n=1 Tax=Roseococcus sp. TaxID=2109646 RepID=UPI003BA9900A
MARLPRPAAEHRRRPCAPPPRRNSSHGRLLIGSNRHHDHVMMAVTAGSTVLAIFLAGLIWIHSGWTGGANFMAVAAVACCFFGAADRPVPMMRSMFVWGGVAMLGAGLFLFTVMPAVHDFELLALCLAPPFLLIGLIMPRPQTFLIAMTLSTMGAGSLALTSRYNVDFASYANENIAVQAGVLFALVWTMATKPFGAALAARRLARAGWADLAALAAGTGRGDHAALAGRMLDRLGQLTPRLDAEGAGHLAGLDGLAELRIGYNVLDLQRDRRRLGPMAKARIDEVLAGVSGHFRDRIGGGPATPPDALLGRIDDALEQTVREADRPVARDAAQALVGLRRGFFPLAPGPRGPAPACAPLAAAA